MDPGLIDLLRDALRSYSQNCTSGQGLLNTVYSTNDMQTVAYNGTQLIIFQAPDHPVPVVGAVRGTLLCESMSRTGYSVPYDITTQIQKHRHANRPTETPRPS